MPHRYHVHVAGLCDDHDLPGRFGTGGLHELLDALGGELDENEDIWAALARTFEATPPQALAERLLDLVLLKPPIPAGCEALVRAMEDASTAPWRTHDVREDRVWLWYCHQLLHRALPGRFAAPAVRRITLQVTPLDAEARPPGRRTVAHDRTTFVARLLAGRPGALTLWPDAGAPEAWAFDALWAVEIGERTRPSPEALLARGAAPGAVDAGQLQEVAMAAWLPDTYLGALEVGDAWTATA